MAYCEVFDDKWVTAKLKSLRKKSVYIKDKFGRNLAKQICSLHLMRGKTELNALLEGDDLQQTFALQSQIKAACALTATSWAWPVKVSA